ncbi:MAG: Uncharacterized protein G01um101444_417 [Parcubacteria group bacterium Gr01-1014_44]|nr:MAG: Uncharacterized protein G01um101444_417 [Parcubacteria group bacterium Gr01-1014_44]
MKNGPENIGSHQESPDEPKIVKKIEVIRAEDFWSPPDDYDYYDQEMIDDAEKYAEEEPKEEPLSYIPFDPKIELKNIRRLPLEELEDPERTDEVKRKIRAEQLVRFKENLIHQKEGIARAVDDLRNAVESTPNATTEILLSRVQALAPEYRFTRDQISLFKYAIEQYQEKHSAVEKYRAMYPNDTNLFEACFGKKPKGKIEVVKGSMTLFFRCFDRDDYAFVNSFYKHRGDETKIVPEDIARANDSGGVAISSVKIEELAGAITAENVGNNSPRYELVKGAEKTEEIHKKEFELFLNSQKGDIDIEVKGVGIWKVKIVEHDEQGEPLRIQFLNLNEVDTPPIFDVLLVEATEEMRAHGNFLGTLKKVSDGQLQYNTIEYLRAGNRIHGHINMDRAFLKIEDQSAQGTTVKYREDEFTMIPNDEMSERTRIHEDQHQFNKLFQPFEAREDVWTMMRRAVNGARSPEEAVQKLIHGYVKLERKWIGFDSRARDEILAYYKEGRGTEETLRILTESKLYDYAEQYKTRIAEIPALVKKELEKEVSEVFYQNVEDFQTAVDVQALEIEESDVQPHIDSVFKEEYKADLKNWLDSISVLEQKGYTKDEIVALLYQEPINFWSNLSRRMKPKIKS